MMKLSLPEFSFGASYGIIGGADGPTAIYVANSTPSPLRIGVCLLVLALLIGLFVYCGRRYDRRRTRRKDRRDE